MLTNHNCVEILPAEILAPSGAGGLVGAGFAEEDRSCREQR